MPRKKSKFIKWAALILLLCLYPSLVHGKMVQLHEAQAVAENWIQFILERDGRWGEEQNPSLGQITELRRGNVLLGYCAAVQPRGYIVVSSLQNFAPIKAYSTDSDLDPSKEGGMAAMLKDDLESRAMFLIRKYGALDDANLEEFDKGTPQATWMLWSYLLQGGALSANLGSIRKDSRGQVGPLLETSWDQGPPYNDDCPDMGCGFAFNDNALVGCVPLGLAQIMRYYCWPPYFDWHYDWPNMLNRYVYDSGSNWFNDEQGNPVTQAQIDAVADLCRDPGTVIHIDYGCSSTGAYMCNWYYDDARDALEDHFFYSNPSWDEPVCEERDSYDFSEWWDMIVREIDYNRPMMFKLANSGGSFNHLVVIDGYDDTGGQTQIHANYGWDDAHTAWYALDSLDCDTAPGFQGGCELSEYELVRYIYPRTAIPNHGTLGPRNSVTDLHHYVYTDEDYCFDLIVEGGAWVQFLPETSLSCSLDSVAIYGRSPDETRFYSEGLPTRGMKVAANGEIRLWPGGGMIVH